MTCAIAMTPNGRPPGRPHLRAAGLALATLLALTMAANAPVARADVSGFGADESLAQAAGPLAAATVYSGAFVSAPDVDYLYFEVPQPETLRFDVVNTLPSCNPYWIEAAPGEVAPGEPLRYYEPFPTCPTWATLLDGRGQQLGGEGSGAGTGPVEYSSYEEVQWTFPQAGRYYLALESEYCAGHAAECQLPSFKLSYRVVPPSEGATGGSGANVGGGGAGAGRGGGSGGGSGIGSGGASKGGSGAASAAGPLASSYGSRQAQSPLGAGSSHSLIRSLRVAHRQRGARVALSMTIARRLLSLDVWVLARIGPHRRLAVVGHLRRRHPIAGPESLRAGLDAAAGLSTRRFTPVLVRVRALGAGHAFQLFQRAVLLRL